MTKELIGQIAPNFTLESSTGDSVSLADYDGKWKVLFFYAKDGSPTCVMSKFQRTMMFQSLTPIEIIGISEDS